MAIEKTGVWNSLDEQLGLADYPADMRAYIAQGELAPVYPSPFADKEQNNLETDAAPEPETAVVQPETDQAMLARRTIALSRRVLTTRLQASAAALVAVGSEALAPLGSGVIPHTYEHIIAGVAALIFTERGIKSIQLGNRLAAHEQVQLIRGYGSNLSTDGRNDSLFNPGTD